MCKSIDVWYIFVILIIDDLPLGAKLVDKLIP